MKCQKEPVFRYTWPGQDEAYICREHAEWMRNVASAIGMHLQLIPLSGNEQEDAECSQEVKAA